MVDINKVKKVKNIYYQVWTYALFISTILFVIIASIYNFSKRTFYFFDHRYDVVLTNSMSAKSERYEEFLHGHDDQIQAFDLVDSIRIKEDTELNVYDIVLFNSPEFGVDMHRIVDKVVEGNIFKINKLSIEQFEGYNTFSLTEVLSSLESLNSISFSNLEMVTYSSRPLEDNYYIFNINRNPSIEVNILTESISDNIYKNIITYDRGTSYPSNFYLYKGNYDFYDHIQSITLSNENTSYKINASEIDKAIKDIDNPNQIIFNAKEKYLIRGDKDESSDGDGWFYKEQLYSKVVNNIPKVGYLVRYISSPYGVILFAGLILIPITAKYIYDKKNKKEKK